MTMTVGSYVSGVTSSPALSKSWSHSIGVGSGQILIVRIATKSVTVTDVTYDGIALTQVSSSLETNTLALAEIWALYKDDLPSAGTYTITVTLSSSQMIAYASTNFYGVLNQAFISDTTTGILTPGDWDNPPLSFDTNPGDVVIDVISLCNVTTSVELTNDGGLNITGGYNYYIGGIYMGGFWNAKVASGLSTSLDWTLVNAPVSTAYYSDAGIRLKYLPSRRRSFFWL
jgi:hypothetical protein